MVKYLAVVIEGLMLPFVTIGRIIGSGYMWIRQGIKEALSNDDIYLAVSYWVVYIIGLAAICSSPLLLLLYKTTATRIAGVVLAFFTIIIGFIVGILLLGLDLEE